jgi:proline iminopeptidase
MNSRHGLLTAALAILGAAATGCEPMSPSEPGALVPRTVAEDASLPAIEINGTRLHAQTMGNPANPVIVFLHGGPGGDYRDMLRLAEPRGGASLAEDYFLVFWDQRSSGLSERHGKPVLTIDQYLADLDAILDRYSPGRKAFLIGESWGGMYATAYINEHPQRVAGAVLVEPGPMEGATMERLKDKIAGFHLWDELLNDVAWSGQFLTGDDHARLDYERAIGLRDHQPESHQSRTDPAPSWRVGAAASRYLMEDGQDASGKFDFDFTTNLGAYTTPVLFVTGSLSEILGASLQQTQVHHFPSATLQVVNGAGHDVAWVKTAEVLSHIRSYLAARRGGAQ